jgi:hypothetical protein
MLPFIKAISAEWRGGEVAGRQIEQKKIKFQSQIFQIPQGR